MACFGHWRPVDGNRTLLLDTWIVITENKSLLRESVSNWVRDKMSVYGGLLSIWTVVLNVILIVVLLTDKKSVRRRDVLSVYRLAINFCAVQLAIGALVIPVNLVTESRAAWLFGGTACRVWLFVQILLVAETIWWTVAVIFDRLLQTVMTPLSYARLSDGRAYAVVFSAASWITSGLALLPVGLSLVGDKDVVLEEVCAVSVTRDDAVVLFLGAFLFPVMLMLTGNVANLAAKLYRGKAGHQEFICPSSSEDQEPEAKCANTSEPTRDNLSNAKTTVVTGSSNTAVVVVSLACAVIWAPFFFTYMLLPFCDQLCIDPAVWSLFIWLGYTNAGLAPAFLFVDPAIRVRTQKVLRSTITCFRMRKSSRCLKTPVRCPEKEEALLPTQNSSRKPEAITEK